MKINNIYTDYISRSYLDIKNNILKRITTDVPELTDLSENNILVRLVSVWAGITEMLGYYINSINREAFLVSARKYSSAIKIAKLFNYRVRSIKSATTQLKFIIDKPLSESFTIPSGTVVKSSNEIKFITTEPCYFPANQTETLVNAIQGTYVINFNAGATTNLPNQIFVIGKNVEDRTTKVKINGVQYSFLDSLHTAKATDKVYTLSINENNEAFIKFGDGITGAIPPSGYNVLVDYIASDGLNGNLPENSITELVTNFTLPNPTKLTVTNNIKSSGGADIETLDNLKVNIPASLRTIERGVTIQDIKDLIFIYGGIKDIIVNKSANSLNIDIHISLTGGGEPSELFKSNLKTYLKDKMQQLILVDYTINNVTTMYPIIRFSIDVYERYNKTEVSNNVISKLIYFVNSKTIQEPLVIGDIYNVINNVDGVKHSDNLFLSYELLIHNKNASKNLSIEYFKLKASNNIVVKLYKIEILSSSKYRVYENNVSMAEPLITDTYDISDFTIKLKNDNYTVGDFWEFYIYNQNKSIYLKSISSYELKFENISVNEL